MEMSFQWPRAAGRTLSPCESWLLSWEGELLLPLRPQLTGMGTQRRLFPKPSLLPPLTPAPLSRPHSQEGKLARGQGDLPFFRP